MKMVNFYLERPNRENGTTFSEFPFVPGIFQWDEPNNRLPFTSQLEFPGIMPIQVLHNLGHDSVGCLWQSHGTNKLQSQPKGLHKIFIDHFFFQVDQWDCTKSLYCFRFASSELSLVSFPTRGLGWLLRLTSEILRDTGKSRKAT